MIVALASAQMMADSSRSDIDSARRPRSASTQLPGVVGIYVCILGHEKSPWLKAILPEPAPEIERQIPCGCRVVTQIFREIRPLRP